MELHGPEDSGVVTHSGPVCPVRKLRYTPGYTTTCQTHAKTPMKTLAEYDLMELKLIYRLLHSHLQDEIELMDSQLLHELQRYLQDKARADGIDVSVHAQWATWLNGGVVVLKSVE